MTINLTQDESYKTFAKLLCSAELTDGTQYQLICLLVVNILISITAFLGNTLILVALHKKSSLHSPSKRLYRNLATTDLCVGIIAEPLHVIRCISVANEQWQSCRYAFIGAFTTGYILCGVSLFTLTAISVDRLLALLLGLRYRQVVTLKRTYLTVVMFWVVTLVGASVYFWNHLMTMWCGYIAISLCLITSTVCYAKIFFTLRQHQITIQNDVHQEQPSQAVPLNIARYRKAVSSALWVQLTLVVCYLPHGIVEAWLTQRGISSSIYFARSLTVTLVYLNSSLNPIIYCWKIREVRKAVKDTIRQLCCSSG